MEAILDVEVLKRVLEPTSWTDKDVPFYLHTVNKKKVINFNLLSSFFSYNNFTTLKIRRRLKLNVLLIRG